MISLHVYFRGRVQGVGFRSFVLGRAREAGLSGWVRNLPDGSVDAVFSGDDETVARIVEACRAAPFPISVRELESHPAEPPQVSGFHVFA